MNNMRALIRKSLKDKVAQQLCKAIDIGTGKVHELIQNMTTAQIAAGTWKAILRRAGEPYTSGKKDNYHWNEDLVSPFFDPLTLSWEAFFRNRLPQIHLRYSAYVGKYLEHFRDAFEAFSTDTCGIYPPIQRMLGQIQLLKNRVAREAYDSLTARQDKSGDAPKIIRQAIKQHMLPFYEEGNEEKGK